MRARTAIAWTAHRVRPSTCRLGPVQRVRLHCRLGLHVGQFGDGHDGVLPQRQRLGDRVRVRLGEHLAQRRHELDSHPTPTPTPPHPDPLAQPDPEPDADCDLLQPVPTAAPVTGRRR